MEGFNWFKSDKAKEEAKKIVGGLDLLKNNEDTLEEDYRIRKIIGREEDMQNTEKLEKMNDFIDSFQDKQKEYFTDLKDQLYNIVSLIQKKEDLLNQLNSDTEKLKELNKKNFQLHGSFSLEDGIPETTDLEKQIYFLKIQVDFLSKKINEENITLEDIDSLRKEYKKLNAKYELLEKTWFPENPSLN